MPRLQKRHAMRNHERTDAVQLLRSKPARSSELHRIKPELRDAFAMLDMDMRRFRSFEAVKEEAEAGNVQYGWHGSDPSLSQF